MAKSINTSVSTINALVVSTLNIAAAYGKGINELRTAIAKAANGTLSRDVVHAALQLPVATYYGVALIDKVRGEGKTLDKEAQGYEAAKKALQRLTADIVGKEAKATEEEEVPAEMLALARKLVKAGMAYENASKLIAKAIATAKAE
jgi:hypothetical protein